MKKAVFAGIIFLLVACGEKKKEVLRDMKDIAPKSERDYTQQRNEKLDTIDFGFNSFVANELGLNLSGIKFNKAPMFPDRFLPKSTKK